MQQQHPKASLGNIASIRSGYPFRERIKHANNGDVRVLQIGDLRSNPVLKAANLPLIKKPNGRSKLLVPGDIVIPARGEHHHAISFNLPEPTLASSQLLILRVTSKTVLPGYLCWALNQPQAQHTLSNESRGTNMPLLTRQSLVAVRVPVPPLDLQKKIIDLQQLWEKEQQLTQKLLNNREYMLKGMFQQLLSGACTTTNLPARNGEQQ